MTRELERRRRTERWIAWVRLVAVPFAVVQVGAIADGYPPGYERWAWVITGVFAAGAVALLVVARRPLGQVGQRGVAVAAVAFDTAVVYAYVLVYTWELGVPVWGVLYLPVIEAALRWGIRGGAALPLLAAGALAAIEYWRSLHFGPDGYELRYVTLPIGLQLLMGVVVGGLVERLREEAEVADERAGEAEALRDQLGRRADQLDAVNRCARALASSLDQDEAFRAFLREVQGVVAFERLAIVLAETGRAEVMAAAGRGEATLFPPGSDDPVEGTIVVDLIRTGQTIVREDMVADPRYSEELRFAEAGLASRVCAPLVLGPRVLGMLSVVRAEPRGFAREEVDLVTLLARQVATAVQNIRTYAAERTAVEELRRLSALRADFVSLVSHELRGPMASVIGCATTLRQRWRELGPEQRESFLALIEEETGRLARLVGDVLDTSRIEAGTFSYTFGDVDVEELVRETAAVAAVGQGEVSVRVEVPQPLPPVRGDRERLKQVLLNLVSNAVKYTVAGDEVVVRAALVDGSVAVSVRDHGPGIAPEHQALIFEKFGRVNTGGKSKPGTGLGLFIARSIAEAHGGTLDVDSQAGTGSTFVVRIPLAGARGGDGVR